MRLPLTVRFLTLALPIALLTSCGGSKSTPTTPTTPTPPAPPAKGALTVTTMSVVAMRTPDGLQYPIFITVRETGGAVVTVNAVDFVFSANGTPFGHTHFDTPFGSTVPANGSATSRTLITTDNSGTAPIATHVAATIAYTDSNSNTGTVNTESDIAPLPDPPNISSFTASPVSINAGQSSTLQWTVGNVTSVSIDNGIGSVNTSGTWTVNPLSTTTYTLSATNPGGTITAKVTVTVNGAASSVRRE